MNDATIIGTIETDAGSVTIKADTAGTLDVAAGTYTYDGETFDIDAELAPMFATLHPAGDWKGRIYTDVAKSLFNRAAAACRYFTGTDLRIVRPLVADAGIRVIVAADGYRLGPCN